MTDYTDKANATLAILQDYARDMAAHLGLASRIRTHNPDLGSRTRFVAPGTESHDMDSERERLTAKFLVGDGPLANDGYLSGAEQATAYLNAAEPDTLTTAEKAARSRVSDLASRIKGVRDLDDANALVASLEA